MGLHTSSLLFTETVIPKLQASGRGLCWSVRVRLVLTYCFGLGASLVSRNISNGSAPWSSQACIGFVCARVALSLTMGCVL